jgi:hypothetical protein
MTQIIRIYADFLMFLQNGLLLIRVNPDNLRHLRAFLTI